jgi:hypothetical protein
MKIIKHDLKTQIIYHKFDISEIWEYINNQMKNDYKVRSASTGCLSAASQPLYDLG